MPVRVSKPRRKPVTAFEPGSDGASELRYAARRRIFPEESRMLCDNIRRKARKAVPRLTDGHVDGGGAGPFPAQQIAQSLKG